MTTGVRRADWQPGDVLPGYWRALHSDWMFKLKDDHECQDCRDGEFWTGETITGSAMHWSPVPQESDRPCA